MNQHAPILGKRQFLADRRHHHFAATHPVAIAGQVHRPLAVAPDGLRQALLERGIDVLGIDQAQRQAAGQGIEKLLDRLRTTQRSGQQPDLAGRLANRQPGTAQRVRQIEAGRTLGLVEQHLQARADRPGRIADQTLELADQTPLPARVVFGAALGGLPLAEQHRRRGLIEQQVDQRRVLQLGQVDQPQVGRAGPQLLLIQALWVTVEQHLIAVGEQGLLQHMALQRSIGDDRNAAAAALSHDVAPVAD
ncbi:hypothetical protein D3C75_795810 [compost metagenome]